MTQYGRRDVLRFLFLGAIGVRPALADFSESTSRAPLLNAGTSEAYEFKFPHGPLSRIGGLVDTGVDGIRAPSGFRLRAVARHLFNPVSRSFDPFGWTGYSWHKAPDGGACFRSSDGGWVYVSNCESKSVGGVGALRFDQDGRVVDAYPLLTRTRRNCAGGATPWQTYLSCEEIHDGLVFECDPFSREVDAVPLPALGRFNHEAAAVDLHSRSVFLTEDADDGRLYRFVSERSDPHHSSGRLDLSRGRLQVLNVSGVENGRYAARDVDARSLRSTHWVDAVEVDQPQATVRQDRRDRGVVSPGTVFRGAEGIWIHQVPQPLRSIPPGGRVPSRAFAFFACKLDNRIYALDVDNDLIETVFDNTLEDLHIRDVDNLVVSPAGDVIVAEDGPATRLILIRPGQRALPLLAAGHERSELTGLAFSPDGSRLYFSSQRGPNLPWRERGTGVTYELLIPASHRRT